MKKVLFLVISLLFIVLFCTSGVFAQGKVCDLKSINATVEIPNDYYVYNIDDIQNSDLLGRVEATESDLREYAELNNSILIASNIGSPYSEIYIDVDSNDFTKSNPDLNKMGKDAIQGFGDGLCLTYGCDTFSYIESPHTGKWLTFEYSLDTVSGTNYFYKAKTISQGTEITIYIRQFDQAITTESINTLNSIVYSLDFGNVMPQGQIIYILGIVILGVIFFYLLKKIKKNPSTNTESVDAQTILSDGPVPKGSQRGKAKFCKYCGSAIDLETGKCTGCGKQYFKLKKPVIKYDRHKVVLICVVAVLCVSIAGNIYQYVDRFTPDIAVPQSTDEQINEVIEERDQALADAEFFRTRCRELDMQLYELRQKYYELQEQSGIESPTYISMYE